MARHAIIVVGLHGMAMLPAFAAAPVGTITPVVAKDAASAKEALDKALATGRAWAVDASYGTGGTIVRGSTASSLPAGCYRVHVLVARSPLGDVYSNAVTVRIDAAGQQVNVNPLRFAVPNEFIDIPIDVTLPDRRPIDIGVAWLVGASAKAAKQKAANPESLDPDGATESTDPVFNLPHPADDATIASADLFKFPVEAAVCTAVVETLSPVKAAVDVDKIVYKPGESGVATITLTNASDAPQNVTLALDMVSGIETTTPVATQTVALPAGGSKTVTQAFSPKDIRWGADFRAAAKTDDGRTAYGSTVFAVTDNMWKVAVMGGQGPDMGRTFKDPKAAAAKARLLRDQGFTGFEMVFWAPDDFGDFNPKTDDFLSGQMQYEASATGTKNFMDAIHANGMYGTVYSNEWGADGLSGFELMRKHPEWISWANFSEQWLELWPRMAKNQIPPIHQWICNSLVTDDKISPIAIRHHIDELIQSHKYYGWDGVRYDSYYTTDWTNMATKMVRQSMEQAAPGFQFGYNSYPKKDETAHGLDVMLDGGGLTMLEYVRLETYPALLDYTNELNDCRELAWNHGGHIGPLYRNPTLPDKPATSATPLDAVYVSTVMLATGSHPYYQPIESEIGEHNKFARRYGEIIWDNKSKPLKDPASVVSFGGTRELFDWKPLARTIKVGDHWRLIVHILNIDPDYHLFTNYAMKTMPPLRNLPVTINLPVGAKVLDAWNLTAVPTARHERLTPKANGSAITLTVPDVRFWNILVLDYSQPAT